MISWGSVPMLLALLCACALQPVMGQFLGLREGTRSCTLHRTSLRGTCQSINDCPFVLKTYRQVTPTFCYLKGRIPYVCCPTRSSAGTDVSPPSVSFSCGTSISKPKIRLLEETHVSKALGIPALMTVFASNADFAPLAVASSFPSLAALASPSGYGLDTPAVTGGIISLKNSWPWVALLGYGSKLSPKWECGGVLINEHRILTAAHCVIHENASAVRLGEHDLSRSGESSHQDFGVSDRVFHPQYDFPQRYHDLALLKLERPVQVNNVMAPICLPWGQKPVPTVGSVLTTIGWGETAYGGSRSDILQEVSIQMIDSQECVKSYSTLSDYRSKHPRGITSDLLCIGDKEGKGRDSCRGDSGGPVMYREGGNYILAGIVSAGYGCGNPDFPGLYASVHYAPHLAWIKRVAF